MRMRVWRLVFSSVERTNSPARRRFPYPAPGVQIEDAAGLERELRITREDRGAMLPGMASSVSQRHTVVLLRRVTIPHGCASRTRSAQLSRGSWHVAGNSHTLAWICTTRSGGGGGDVYFRARVSPGSRVPCARGGSYRGWYTAFSVARLRGCDRREGYDWQ